MRLVHLLFCFVERLFFLRFRDGDELLASRPDSSEPIAPLFRISLAGGSGGMISAGNSSTDLVAVLDIGL